MFTKTQFALAIVLGVLGTASSALAGSERDDTDRGGYVVAGSLTGVNPVYHPELFSNAYGSVTSPNQHKGKKLHNR
jgi:hypothetical protein